MLRHLLSTTQHNVLFSASVGIYLSCTFLFQSLRSILEEAIAQEKALGSGTKVSGQPNALLTRENFRLEHNGMTDKDWTVYFIASLL